VVAPNDVVDVVEETKGCHTERRNQQPSSQLGAYWLHSWL